MSGTLVNLLESMLTKNPTERSTIEQIISHPWLSEIKMPISRVPTLIDPEVLSQLAVLNLDVKQIEIDLLRDEFTPETAMYRSIVREKLSETLKKENLVTTSQSSSKLMNPPIGAQIDKRRKSIGVPIRLRASPGTQTVQVVAVKSKPSPIHARLAPIIAVRETARFATHV
jgi:serine/threonine protein kinase